MIRCQGLKRMSQARKPAHHPANTSKPQPSDRRAVNGEPYGADDKYPLRWRRPPGRPWPALPTLEGYDPLLNWMYTPATHRERRELRSFGVTARRSLTRGEPHHLIRQCIPHTAAEPPDPEEADRRNALRPCQHLPGWAEFSTDAPAQATPGV